MNDDREIVEVILIIVAGILGFILLMLLGTTTYTYWIDGVQYDGGVGCGKTSAGLICQSPEGIRFQVDAYQRNKRI